MANTEVTESLGKEGQNLVFVGIILGVFASMSGTIGKQLLRFSELVKRRGNIHAAKVALGIGLALNTAVGPIVDMLSYAFAPQSLIAPLGGLDVVWNTMVAPCTLGEKLTPLVIFGAFLIAAGATATSFFGNHDDKDYDIDVLQDTFMRPAVAFYFGGLCIWLLFNITVLQVRSAAPKGQPWATGDRLRGLSLGITAGSLAGNMFCVKGFVELVEASIRDGDGTIWAHWMPYVLLLGAIVFAVSNLRFLTTAMREYEALFMGAVFEGSLIVCAAVSGIIVYKDLEDLEWLSIFMYFLALFSIVVGIGVVAIGCWKPEDKDANAEKDNDESETEGNDNSPSYEPVISESTKPQCAVDLVCNSPFNRHQASLLQQIETNLLSETSSTSTKGTKASSKGTSHDTCANGVKCAVVGNVVESNAE